MIVCGIHRCKAEATKSTIVKAFQFYDVKRHQFEEMSFGISREDIVCSFRRKCSMTYMEALLAYDIVKRAVKAFYNDTPDYSVRSPVAEAVILKEHQYAWQHAARKTARLFEKYENVFFNAHHCYSQQIVKIYNQLFDRIRNRADPVIVEDFHPRGCVRKESKNQKCVVKCQKEKLQEYIKNLPTKTFPIKNDELSTQMCDLVFNTKSSPKSKYEPKKVEKKPKNVDLNLPRCYQCNCPKIICDCAIQPDTGIVAIDCSQGPFECQWFRIDKEDKPDPCIEKSEFHQCPVDCLSTDESSESNDGTGYCECSNESDSEESDNKGVEREVYEMSDNEENINRMMPTDMPKRVNCHKHQTRNISKLPNMMDNCTLSYKL